MSLLNLPPVKAWLEQFRGPDLYLAEYMLAKLRYVSFQELEDWLQTSLEETLSTIESKEKQSVALFPVAKPFVHEFNKDKETKPTNDSGGRISHALTNLSRRLPDRFEVTPRIESMRARKVKHIIFVDDFIGTGDRFIKSWRKTVSRSVKAWVALGWCKVWILSYAAHRSGIANIVRNIKAIEPERVICGNTIDKSFIRANRDLIRLFARTSENLADTKSRFGYGNLLSPFVFQHGCPNNAPGILWCKRKSKQSIQPLFPNRSVHPDLYPIFGKDHSAESAAEELWLAKHYSMAIQFLERPEDFGERRIELAILAYISTGKELSRIRSVMVLSDQEFEACLRWLQTIGAIDEDQHISRFGTEILRRGSRARKKGAVVAREYSVYYPSRFMGFQRNV